jgi:hypothetical protein
VQSRCAAQKDSYGDGRASTETSVFAIELEADFPFQHEVQLLLSARPLVVSVDKQLIGVRRQK